MSDLLLSAAQCAWVGAGLGFLALMYRQTVTVMGHHYSSLYVAAGAGLLAVIVLLGGV